ncbi:hypothetical protein FQZ97_954230 [compost metagenome]
MHVARREVRGEGIGQALLAGQLGAEQAGAEQPDRHLGATARHGDHPLIGRARAQVTLQLLDILGEVVGAAGALAAQRAGGVVVSARRAAQPQVDTPRIQGGEGAELLGNYQRCMIGQHHPAGAKANT